MKILTAICVLHVVFHNVNCWQLFKTYLAAGHSCKINNVYAGTCKLQYDCDSNPNERDSKSESHSSDSDDDKECASHHVCCPYRPATTYQIPVQDGKPGFGELCRTSDGSTGTCRRQSVCYTEIVISHESTYEHICGSSNLICCLDFRRVPTLKLTSTNPKKDEKPRLGDECSTPSGSKGSCTLRTSCRFVIDTRSGADKCGPSYVCCTSAGQQAPTTESQTVQSERSISSSQSGVKLCQTVTGIPGVCTFRQQCTRFFNSGSASFECDADLFCCPFDYLTALTTTAAGPVTSRKLSTGEECSTVAGNNGRCAPRTSCNTLDHNIDIRYGEDKCASQLVCCPETGFQATTWESPTISRTPSVGHTATQAEVARFGDECNTAAGARGVCIVKTSCTTLDFSSDISTRPSDDKCAPVYVCCPNTTVRPESEMSIAEQSVRPERTQLYKVCSTDIEAPGVCALRHQCRHLDYSLGLRGSRDVCDVSQICCPADNFAAVTATTAGTAPLRKPTGYQMPTAASWTSYSVTQGPSAIQSTRQKEEPHLGEKCNTVAGTRGSCAERQVCSTLEFSIDIRHGDDKCAPKYVCCPDNGYEVSPTEPSLVRQPTTPKRRARIGENCNTIAGTEGHCTLKRSCMTLDYNIDMRYGGDKCSPEYVCCPNTSYLAPTEESSTVRREPEEPSMDLFDPIALERPVESRNRSTEAVGFNCVAAGREDRGVQCGFRQAVGIKMLGTWSRPIEKYEFPWMVAVIKTNLTGKRITYNYICGGSLVHYRVVLTAAHCVDGEARLRVRVGVWELSQWEVETQEAVVTRVIIHPDYNSVTNIYDVALVMTQKKFKKSPNIGLICLPTSDITVDVDSCVVTGWGQTVEKNSSQELRMETHPLLDGDTCRRRLIPAISTKFTLHESFVCAGGGSYGPLYKGDGGAPLVCTNGVRFYQRGVAAWGVQGGHGFPEVYLDVSKVVPWISEQMHAYRLKC